MSPLWFERKLVDEEGVDRLEAAGYPRLLARLLVGRGISAADEAEKYFSPELRDLASAEELPGIEAAAAEILAALRGKKQIVVWGDYDCDGVAATAILVKVLRALDGAADIRTFIPHRIREGFGFSEGAYKRFCEEFPRVGLVVTVDTGVNAASYIRDLQGRGVRCVVTDHHLPGDELPPCAVVNPDVASSAALAHICGAAVAFFLALYLVKKAQEEGLYKGPKVSGPLLVLAGLATMADVVPLIGQNRILLVQSLRLFSRCAPIGLIELYGRATRRAADHLTAYDYGFKLAPRVNAMGRMDRAEPALELFLVEEREKARALALQVDLKNVERKATEARLTVEAKKLVREGTAAQVINLPEGHLGVAGIVAASVMASVRPCVPVCVVEGNGHGSARAPEGYNVYEALAKCAEFLETFGGHKFAAGLTVKEGEIDHFRERFCEVCAAQCAANEEKGTGGVLYDAEVSAADLSLELAEKVEQMEPFGAGNLEPIFLMRGVHFKSVRVGGQDKNHVFASLEECADGRAIQAVWWRNSARVEELRQGARVHDILFKLKISTFGVRQIELELLEVD